MQWSKNTPTEPGIYYQCFSNRDIQLNTRVVHVYPGPTTLLVSVPGFTEVVEPKFYDVMWCGPFLLPKPLLPKLTVSKFNSLKPLKRIEATF